MIPSIVPPILENWMTCIEKHIQALGSWALFLHILLMLEFLVQEIISFPSWIQAIKSNQQIQIVEKCTTIYNLFSSVQLEDKSLAG